MVGRIASLRAKAQNYIGVKKDACPFVREISRGNFLPLTTHFICIILYDNGICPCADADRELCPDPRSVRCKHRGELRRGTARDGACRTFEYDS